ncbi:hypothetical protein JTB14_016769 [Gonioctena quinquepunctata]|nr:hypothetical protein JTB14_016769 [Gonioctena quinquepunctata]
MARRYSEEQMQKALAAVADGMKVFTASRTFCVPKTTLLYKSAGVYPIERKIGPETVLSTKEETLLVRWIFHVGNVGFPVTKNQLLDSVEMLVKKLKRTNKFTDGRPGMKPSCADIQKVYNRDETVFFLSPEENKVIVKRGEKAVYNFINNEGKEYLTTLICGNAKGMLAPPTVMFSYQRIPNHIMRNMPADWEVGRSESGSMTAESFYEYIANIFHPWLVRNNIQLPVVLFVDGHSSHLTMALSDFCVENGIELVALFPNSTHILQPLDVAILRPLKASWKSVVHNWRIEHNGERLKCEHFGLIVNRALAIVDFEKVLPNGFCTCGLHPSTPDAIKYGRIIKSQEEVVTVEKEQENVDSVLEHLKCFEAQLNAETSISFQNSPDLWTGNLEYKNLFHFWQKLKLEVQSRNDTNHTPDTGTETDEIILNPGDDVDWVNQILGDNHSVESLIVNDNSEPENHTPTSANELLHMDENTNLNNAELNVANENEHFMITQDKIDEILPNGVAAAIVVENVNNNYIENNEPISSMINLSQTATEA